MNTNQMTSAEFHAQVNAAREREEQRSATTWILPENVTVGDVLFRHDGLWTVTSVRLGQKWTGVKAERQGDGELLIIDFHEDHSVQVVRRTV